MNINFDCNTIVENDTNITIKYLHMLHYKRLHKNIWKFYTTKCLNKISENVTLQNITIKYLKMLHYKMLL